jgi:hypothetical protein
LTISVSPNPRAITNGSHQNSTLMADFPNLGEAWLKFATLPWILLVAWSQPIEFITLTG